MTTSLLREQPCHPKENILRIWKATETRSQMKTSLEFVEYIWLRRLCHQFKVLGLDHHTSPGNVASAGMEEFRSISLGPEQDDGTDSSGSDSGSSSKKSPLRHMSVFSFLDAIRLHKSVSEIEKHRKGPNESPRKRNVNTGIREDISNARTSLVFSSDKEHDIVPSSSKQGDVTSNTSPTPSTSKAGMDTEKFFQNFNWNSKTSFNYAQNPDDQVQTEYTYTYSYSDALKYAIMYGHVEYTIYLLETHLEEALLETICCPLLLVAVRLGHPDIIEQLCSHSRRKASHNNYIDKSGCSAMEGGRTALHVAAEMGNVTILRLLLKYGADARVTDDHGQTPLDRVLYRLQAPHITNKTVRCIHELLKCLTIINVSQIAAISRKIMESAATLTDCDRPIIAQLMYLEPGPLSLKHLCRVSTRRRLTYPYLPEGLWNICLPNSLIRYLELND